ncbi:GNAT family N-acetyltransferase [Gemmobacter fulvus]|uniref:GNAT family N-acetyltransferase n=1 Tax=Gemmobacter fulvus TaxID=2840474 RepID=UPI0027968191|nr:GNAT family N-acetyltransferase [Gemmobacter fulvus]MDQ1849734.1 GNAT family N-acetyltransferase [Gemmobacter fulvus]
MTKDAYQTIARTPTVSEYLHLRSRAGLSAFSEAAATKGLAGTIFAVVVEQGGTAIGMGRLVGDGGCFFQVVDIAVDPAHQGRGLGKAIMAALTVFMADKLPPSAYVSLIADVPAQELYKQFGFQETAPRSLGMARRAG